VDSDPNLIYSESSIQKREVNTMFSGALSPMHWIIVLVIVLIIFGPGKLPGLGKSIGETIKGFKNALNDPEEKKTDISQIEHK
jgi:sec-independent protein translocase protein TatA